MTKQEIVSLLTCEQWGAFKRTEVPVAHALPDGRYILWWDDYVVHEFITAWDIINPKQQEELQIALHEDKFEGRNVDKGNQPVDNGGTAVPPQCGNGVELQSDDNGGMRGCSHENELPL